MNRKFAGLQTNTSEDGPVSENCAVLTLLYVWVYKTVHCHQNDHLISRLERIRMKNCSMYETVVWNMDLGLSPLMLTIFVPQAVELFRSVAPSPLSVCLARLSFG